MRRNRLITGVRGRTTRASDTPREAWVTGSGMRETVADGTGATGSVAGVAAAVERAPDGDPTVFPRAPRPIAPTRRRARARGRSDCADGARDTCARESRAA